MYHLWSLLCCLYVMVSLLLENQLGERMAYIPMIPFIHDCACQYIVFQSSLVPHQSIRELFQWSIWVTICSTTWFWKYLTTKDSVGLLKMVCARLWIFHLTFCHCCEWAYMRMTHATEGDNLTSTRWGNISYMNASNINKINLTNFASCYLRCLDSARELVLIISMSEIISRFEWSKFLWSNILCIISWTLFR